MGCFPIRSDDARAALRADLGAALVEMRRRPG
jgi:hypothetical protein